MITLLNTSILTNYGVYLYAPLTLENAKKEIHNNEWQSAIGHQSTAEILSDLLGIECPVNRIQYKQGPSDTAIVFKLNGRVEEGRILSRDEIEEIGYQFGELSRIDSIL